MIGMRVYFVITQTVAITDYLLLDTGLNITNIIQRRNS